MPEIQFDIDIVDEDLLFAGVDLDTITFSMTESDAAQAKLSPIKEAV